MLLWLLILALALILIRRRSSLVAFFAEIQYRRGKQSESLKLYQLADKIGTLKLDDKLMLGYVCLRCGDLEGANKHLRLCSTMTPRGSAERNQVRSLLALVSWKEGRLDDAIEELEEILASGYKNTVLYQNLGIFYNLSQDTEKALQCNLEAYDYNADDQVILDNLANAYANAGQYEKAAALYDELIHQDPEPSFPEAYYTYGEILLHLGRKAEGIAMIEKSLTKPFSFLSVRPREEIVELCRQSGGNPE